MQAERRDDIPRDVKAARIALVALIALVILGVSVQALVNVRHESRKNDCQDRLRRIGVCFETYHTKYSAWPTPGEETWFRLLWTSGVATDPDIFRCPMVDSKGPGTHFRGITGPGVMAPFGAGATYCWTMAGITPGAPPGFPMAIDDDYKGLPNHGAKTDRNILYFEGFVGRLAIGSPEEGYFCAMTGTMVSGWAAPAGTK